MLGVTFAVMKIVHYLWDRYRLRIVLSLIIVYSFRTIFDIVIRRVPYHFLDLYPYHFIYHYRKLMYIYSIAQYSIA